MKALAGIRVLEVATMVAAPYAARLLGDLGAEVIKVEPPEGDESRRHGPFRPDGAEDPECSGLFLALNSNKQSAVVDLDSVQGQRRLSDLIDQADIVVHDLPADRAAEVGLESNALLDKHPRLVVCAVTPFGHTGPQADWAGHEINVVHGGGWGWLIPGDDPDPAAPPLTVFGHTAHYQAGLAAAMVSIAALHKATATGVGESIDLSVMAHVSAMLEAAFVAWSYRGDLAGRNGGRMLTPWNIYPCRDGLIFLVTVEQDQWLRLVDMMGQPEWTQLESFSTIANRAENQDLLNHFIQQWTSQHDVEALFHEGQRRRVCFAPVFTMADLAEQEHLRDRGFFHRAPHPRAGELTYMGSPFKATPDPWALRTAAPLLGSHGDNGFSDSSERPAFADLDTSRRTTRPLDGVRVIDFSWVWAGPYCTMHLAFLGAEVIKIESSKRPSLGRRLPVMDADAPESLNTCGYFNQWDQGKWSVELDLTDPAALDQVLALIADADVVVDNYATGVMDRLGLSDDALRAVNPNVIIASVTGYGHTGPLREYMGYGPTTAPLSGLTSMTGHLGGRPEEAGLSFGDPAAGLSAAFGIVASLFGRTRGDAATRIDVSLWEATAVNAAEAWMGHQLGAPPQQPIGNRHPRHAPHGLFRCAGDDTWISIACMSDGAWQSLASAIDSELAEDSRFATAALRKSNEADLDAIVSAWTAGRDRWDVTEQLQALGVAAYPSLNCAEVEANEQHVARGFWERFHHPEVGSRTHSGVAWRTRNWTNGVTKRAPLLGEHNNEILG